MKQLLFTLIIFTISLNSSPAQNSSVNEDVVWDIIRTRLFGENYSKAFRYEKDIRIKLDGTPTKRDSQIVLNLINELKPLLETVKIDLVNENANFDIEFLTSELSAPNQRLAGWRYKLSEIEYSYISIVVPQGTPSDSAYIRYFIVRHLTRTFNNRSNTFNTEGGIMSQPPNSINVTYFNFIDKNILQKLYSYDFYEDLRKNTIEKKGYLAYLKLRYENILNNFLLVLTFVIIVLVFLHLLYRHKLNEEKSFVRLLKRNLIVFVTISLLISIYSIYLDLGDHSGINYRNFLTAFLLTLLFSVLTATIIYLLERLTLKLSQNFWIQQTFVFINVFVAIGIAFSLLAMIPLLIYHDNIYDNVPQKILSSTPLLLLVAILAFLRVLLHVITFFIQKNINQKDVEIAKMKELKNQAELHALHSRINPHFLYNSLNSIASLAHTDADKTENMATGLSDLFRYSINKENKTFVSVAEELEMVKKYLEIEKTRFGNRLTYEINAEESTLEKQIPKFLIQPLVENAIKHGLSKMKGNGKIRLAIKQKGKDLVLSIFDNGPDFPDEPVSGYGLQNLHDKLDIIYGNQALINWENGEDKNFTIILKNQFEL